MHREAIDAEVLRAALAPRFARVDVVEQTGSTNADLLADVDAPDRSVLVAEHQLAARGRLERVWSSPPRAGLTFSVLLRPQAPIPTWGWLPLLAGVALYEAVLDASGVEVALKWPNDLLAISDGRKLAGILAQTSGEAVVVGIGMNVSTTAEELVADTATSLVLCGATEIDRATLLVAVLCQLDEWMRRWTRAGGNAEECGLATAYRQACATIGQLVTVTATDGRVLTGAATGIDSDGRLQVQVDGIGHLVGAGDVVHLRPA